MVGCEKFLELREIELPTLVNMVILSFEVFIKKTCLGLNKLLEVHVWIEKLGQFISDIFVVK